MKPTKTHDSNDMPADIDFSQGTRGKFYRPDAKINLPLYLDPQVQATLAAVANAKGVDISALANDLLKKDIELIQLTR